MPRTFGGMDDSPNPLGGAQALETRFEQSWQSGGADSQDPKEAATLREQRGQPEAKEPDPKVVKEPETAVEPEEGPAEYASFDDYLTKSQLDRDSFLTLPVRIGEVDLPLADVLKRAEAAQGIETQTTALTQRQQAFEIEQTRQAQAWQQKLTQAEQLGNIAYQELQREYQTIDWNALSQTDPGRWAVLNTQFQQRATAINQHLGQIQQQQQESAQKALAGEHQKLLQAFPDWKEPAKREAALNVMEQIGQRYGIDRNRLMSITDSISLRVLYDYGVLAAKEAARSEQSNLALKKVRAAPQITTPGARIAKDPKVTAITQARQSFHKNPKSVDAQLAFANRIADNL